MSVTGIIMTSLFLTNLTSHRNYMSTKSYFVYTTYILYKKYLINELIKNL